MKITNTTLFLLISIGFTGCFDGEVKLVKNYKTFSIDVDRTQKSTRSCFEFELIDEDTFTHQEAKYWEDKMNESLEEGETPSVANFDTACGNGSLSSDFLSCSIVITNNFQDWGNYTKKEETKLNLYFKIPKEVPAELVSSNTICNDIDNNIARDSGTVEKPITVAVLINIAAPYEKDDGEVIDAEGSYCLDYSFKDLREFSEAHMDYLLEEGGLYEEGEYTSDEVSLVVSHHRGQSCAQIKGSNTTTNCGTFEYTESKESGLSSLVDPPQWFSQSGSDTLNVGFYTYDLDEISEEDLDNACGRMQDNPFGLKS